MTFYIKYKFSQNSIFPDASAVINSLEYDLQMTQVPS